MTMLKMTLPTFPATPTIVPKERVIVFGSFFDELLQPLGDIVLVEVPSDRVIAFRESLRRTRGCRRRAPPPG